jgi:hypothetical protein
VSARESPPLPPNGPIIDVFKIAGGRSQISGTASQGGRHRHFFVLMVCTPGSLALPPRGAPLTFLMLMVDALGSPSSPPMGPTVDVFYVDDGRSRIFNTASQGAHHRHLQDGWWALSDLRHRLSGGPPSTSLRWVVGALGSSAPPPRDSVTRASSCHVTSYN